MDDDVGFINSLHLTLLDQSNEEHCGANYATVYYVYMYTINTSLDISQNIFFLTSVIFHILYLSLISHTFIDYLSLSHSHSLSTHPCLINDPLISSVFPEFNF